MTYAKEFESIKLLLNTAIKTRAVDAFSLSFIKAERQIRKIFTYLIFQAPSFQKKDIQKLIEALAENKKIDFDDFIYAFDEIYPKKMKAIYGKDYASDLEKLYEAKKIRNKIFHGQLTGKNLSRSDLKRYICWIRRWCQQLANTMMKEIYFDGFKGKSFRKSKHEDIFENCNFSFTTIEEYRIFINNISSKK